VFGGWCLEGGLYPAGCSPLTSGSVGKRIQGTGVTRDINTDDSSRPGRPPVHLLSTSDISQWSFAKPLFSQRDGEEDGPYPRNQKIHDVKAKYGNPYLEFALCI